MIQPTAARCLLVTALAMLASPARAQDHAPTACVVPSAKEAVSGTYLAALRIETRKAALSWRWIVVTRAGDCPAGQPVLALSPAARRAVLILPGRGRRSYDLEAMQGGARARSLARAVTGDLSALADDPPPLLDSDDSIELGRGSGNTGAAVDEPGLVLSRKGAPRSLAWVVRAGGVYQYHLGTGRHLGGPSLEAGISLLEGRLAISLQGAYLAASEVDLDNDVSDLQGGEILVAVRGGLRFSTVILRAGIGVGWQRLDVTGQYWKTDPQGLRRWQEELNASSDAGTAALDLELLWSFAGRWSAGLLFGARAFFGATGDEPLELMTYNSVPVALGGQLAVGVAL